jgi:hypothetical protein
MCWLSSLTTILVRVLAVSDMSNKLLVMNAMNDYFPFLIVHVERVIYTTLDGVTLSI